MDNYQILRTKIQEYIAKLHREGADDKSVAEKYSVSALTALGGVKEVIADDLLDILQSLN